MSAGAGSVVVANNAIIHQARIRQCEGVVESFKSQGSTITEQRQYADCVHLLHPQPISSGAEIFLKIAIIIAIVSAIVGTIREWRKTSNMMDTFMGGTILYALTSMLVSLVFLLIASGVCFLLN